MGQFAETNLGPEDHGLRRLAQVSIDPLNLQFDPTSDADFPNESSPLENHRTMILTDSSSQRTTSASIEPNSDCPEIQNHMSNLKEGDKVREWQLDSTEEVTSNEMISSNSSIRVTPTPAETSTFNSELLCHFQIQ